MLEKPMPISIKSDCLNSGMDAGSSRSITIGLINNMPDSALEATERQFVSLLHAAAAGIEIRLVRYMLPEVPRQAAALHYLNTSYTSVEGMWDQHLDGLIVTGREPLTPNLRDEPYWNAFARVVDWAQANTYSTVWSCLAAHAAVLHLDDIPRVRRADKLCGILECDRTIDHTLTQGAPLRLRLPHSRWNGLREDDLNVCGYRVLTRCADGEIDTFMKQQGSLFVFFQGHPEYEADTLLREYRRDVGRYFKGEAAQYPSMPLNYFASGTKSALHGLEKQLASRNEKVFEEISRMLSEATITDCWRSSAVGFYKNWLKFLCRQKEQSLPTGTVESIAQRASVEFSVPAGGLDDELIVQPSFQGIEVP
jgi:homoserine O-succinyltransferase/O-acetyltransferase